MEIGAVTKTVFDETKDVIVTWFGVLSQGESAFASVDLATNSALLFALRFLFYISLADFAVSILPVVVTIGGFLQPGVQNLHEVRKLRCKRV